MEKIPRTEGPAARRLEENRPGRRPVGDFRRAGAPEALSGANKASMSQLIEQKIQPRMTNLAQNQKFTDNDKFLVTYIALKNLTQNDNICPK